MSLVIGETANFVSIFAIVEKDSKRAAFLEKKEKGKCALGEESGFN